MSVDRHEQLAIVTVHGTGDTAEELEGPKWFQRGSAFSYALQGDLAAAGLDCEIIPLLWSGANSATAREQGSRKLVRVVGELRRQGKKVHVVAHSHGGNVATDAACMLGWRANAPHPTLVSVTTVGTPFLHARMSLSETIGAWVFLAVAALGLLASIGAGALVFSLVSSGQSGWSGWLGRGALLPLGMMAASAFALPIALAGVRRVLWVRRGQRSETKIRTIWHPADEAISFLQQLEATRINPFPPNALFRRSRSGAVTWGVRAALSVAPVVFVSILGWPVVWGVYTMLRARGLPELGVVEAVGPTLDAQFRLDEASYSVLLAILFGAAAFAVVYALYRLAFGVLAEFIFRGALNRSVGGALKGIAFGRDGESRIGDVDVKSRYFGVEALIVAGETAERMATASADATRRLFEKYRASVFRVGGDPGNTLRELSHDALTWDTLVHTGYFDQPDIRRMIADGIIAQSAPGVG